MRAKPCPQCQSRKLVLRVLGEQMDLFPLHRVECKICGWHGAERLLGIRAIAAWNHEYRAVREFDHSQAITRMKKGLKDL